MKKLLLISYYWPPAGGAGVQRWLKMSKYLPENGWIPIVYTAIPTQFVAEDHSLLSEVHEEVEVLKTPIVEPYDFYRRLTGRKKGKSHYSGFISDGKESFAQKVSVFIRSNFFIPDARKWWIKPSITYLDKWLKDNHVDAIVSTGPPHSMHMIALALKKKYPHIPWVVDFRDPWTNIDYYKDLSLMKFADAKHRRFEKLVLTSADRVVAVTWDMAREFEVLASGKRIDVILNGYDPADFEDFQNKETDKFIICHLGSMNKDRNPNNLWQAVNRLLELNPSFKARLEIHLVGPVDYAIHQSIERFGLKGYTVFKDFIPHDEAIKYLEKCNLLLLSINDSTNSKGILPTKLYEYLASKKPVLAVGPKDGDIARVLNELDHCALIGYDDNNIEDFILKVFNDPPMASTAIQKYSRRSQAADFSQLLNELL